MNILQQVINLIYSITNETISTIIILAALFIIVTTELWRGVKWLMIKLFIVIFKSKRIKNKQEFPTPPHSSRQGLSSFEKTNTSFLIENIAKSKPAMDPADTKKCMKVEQNDNTN